jgi:hypothetical protein
MIAKERMASPFGHSNEDKAGVGERNQAVAVICRQRRCQVAGVG